MGSLCVPPLSTVQVGTGHLASGVSPGAIQHSRAFPSPPSGKASEPPSPHLATAQCPGAQESGRPGLAAKAPSQVPATADRAWTGQGPRGRNRLGRWQGPLSVEGRVFIWRCKGTLPLPCAWNLRGKGSPWEEGSWVGFPALRLPLPSALSIMPAVSALYRGGAEGGHYSHPLRQHL